MSQHEVPLNQFEVQIMGQSYMLICPENGELRLREAVARVDSAMCNIRDLGKIKARDRIAVLAALNLTFELLEPLYHEPIELAPEEAAKPDPQLESLLQRLETALGRPRQPD